MSLSKKIILIASAAVLLVAAYIITKPKITKIEFTTEAQKYSSTDPDYKDTLTITVSGELSKSVVSQKSFRGTIEAPGVAGLNPPPDMVKMTFDRNNRASLPAAVSSYGAALPSEVVEIITNDDNEYAIIVLFSDFKTGGSTTAEFNKSSFEFICVGDISRARALEIINSGGE